MSDVVFSQALANSDNTNILHSVCLRFKYILSEDDLSSSRMIALWSALQKYDNRYTGMKFTTFLYKKIQWECYKLAKKEYRFRGMYKQFETIYDNGYEYVSNEEILELLPINLSLVMRQKFIDKLTLKEIGRKNGYSHETARKRIKDGVKIVKKYLISG